MGFVHWLESIGAKLHNLFTSHEAALHTIATDLEMTAASAVAIASAAGETKVVPILSGIADGAGKISTAIQAGAQASNLTEAVGAVTGLAAGLVTSGDIGVKDSATQNQIGLVLTKVNNVAEASQAAVSAASSS